MEHDDTSYSVDDTVLIICDYMQEVLALNPMEDYLDKCDDNNVEREPLEKPPRKQ